jgi:hypothetical protein
MSLAWLQRWSLINEFVTIYREIQGREVMAVLVAFLRYFLS